jgi:Molybdopterin oxidoreductase Fe4S4 domain/Molybdopterin oxidoreductase
MTDRVVRTVRSFCRICTAVCGILVDVSGDEVVRVRGDQEHPFSHGYTCPKGRALPRMHHHPDRLERPLMRIVDRLQPTTWDACLDDLATRLRAVIETHGPEAIGVFFGSGVGMDAAGYRMAEALYAALGTHARFSPLTIDGTAKVLVSDLVGGFPGLNPHVDNEGTKLVVYVGVNPTATRRQCPIPCPPSGLCARGPTSGPSTLAVRKRRGSRRVTSRLDRVPTRRSSRGWHAKCSATVPIKKCSATAPSGTTRWRRQSSRSRSSMPQASPMSTRPT